MFNEIDNFYRWQRHQTLRERAVIWGLLSSGALTLTLSACVIGFNTQLEKVARGAGALVGGVLCGVAAVKSYGLVDSAGNRAAANVARIDLCAWKHAQLVQMATESELQESEPVALLPEAMQFFDWQLFNSNPDKWPHLAVVGGTGDGKSFTTEWAIGWLDGLSVVCHPHRKPKDYPGVKAVYSGGRNYGDWELDEPINFDALVAGTAGKVSFASFLKTIEIEMDRRYKLYEQGIEDYPMINVVLDEFNTALSKVPDAIEAWKNLIREARKVRIRLLCLLQNDSVKSLKIEGDGALRECLKYVRLGGFAKAHAKRLKDESLIAWLKVQKYPILVEEFPATITQLPPGNKPKYTLKIAKNPPIQQPTNGIDFPDKPTGSYQDMAEKFERMLRLEAGYTVNDDGLQVYEVDSTVYEPETLSSKEYTESQQPSIVAKYFPGVAEIDLWRRLLTVDSGSSSPSELIKKGLGCTRSEGNRSYQDVGKPVFAYLVQKYGSHKHLIRFKEFLDNG